MPSYTDLLLEDAASLLAASISSGNSPKATDDGAGDEFPEVQAGEQKADKKPNSTGMVAEGEDEDEKKDVVTEGEDDEETKVVDVEESDEDEDWDLTEGEDSDEEKEVVKEGEDKEDELKTEGEDKDSEEMKTEADDSDEDKEVVKEGEDKDEEELKTESDDSDEDDLDKLAEGEDDEDKEVVKEADEKDEEELKTEAEKDEDDDSEKLSEAVKVLGGNLSEEFKGKMKVVFESAVKVRVARTEKKILETYKKKLKESKKRSISKLVETVDTYLDYVANQFIKENKLAVERGLRVEMTESLMSGLKSLFESHYVDVPAGKVNVIEDLQVKLESSETKLNRAISENAKLFKEVKGLHKKQILNSICEGLSQTQAEQLKEFASTVKHDDPMEFEKSVKILKEAKFPAPTVKSPGKIMTERTNLKVEKVQENTLMSEAVKFLEG